MMFFSMLYVLFSSFVYLSTYAVCTYTESRITMAYFVLIGVLIHLLLTVAYTSVPVVSSFLLRFKKAFKDANVDNSSKPVR